jgi:hypothetical protein
VDPARQVAAYGNTAQPAIAARMAPHQRLIMIGTACACGRSHRRCGSGRGISVVRWSGPRTGVGRRCTRLSGADARHLCHSSHRLAARNGLTGQATTHRTCMVKSNSPGSPTSCLTSWHWLHSLRPWRQRGRWLVIHLGRPAGRLPGIRARCSSPGGRAISALQRPSGHHSGAHPPSQRAFPEPQTIDNAGQMTPARPSR